MIATINQCMVIYKNTLMQLIKGGVKLKRAILVSWKDEEDKQVMQYLSDNSLKLATLVRDLVLKEVRKVGK